VEEMGEYEIGALERVARYEHDPSRVDALLAQLAGSKRYTVADALGSVYEVVDPGTTVQARYSYDAYGVRTASHQGVASPWGYTGRRQDPTGAVYYRSRYFDAGTGLFIQRDEIGVSQGTHGAPNGERFHHPYIYGAGIGPDVAIAPTIGGDPFGLFSISNHQLITAAALMDLVWIDPDRRLRDASWRIGIIAGINDEHDWIDTVHQPQNRFHTMRDSDENVANAAIRWTEHVDSNIDRGGTNLRWELGHK
jgi:RHS repeat-associated protein